MVMSGGETNFTLWFVPSTYEYDVTPMSWADPSVFQTYNTVPSAGEVVIGNVSGKQFSFREGRGITSKFLERQLTDGEVTTICRQLNPIPLSMFRKAA